jgi:glucose/arabinose dehydrogenase
MNDLIRAAAVAAFAIVCGIAASAGAAVVATRSGPVNVDSLAKLDNPWGMTFLPDGRLLITEKPGRLRIYAEGKLSDPIAGVPTVAYRGQGGLLDVEIDPDFARNKLVYLSYAEPAEQQPADARDVPDPRLGVYFDEDDNVLKGGAVARGRLDGDRLANVQVIWRQVPKTIGRGHFGGRLVFAPDGKLFITSGERQRFEPAQDLSSNLGKVVRINPDGTMPSDNPFAKQPGARPDVWTLGHRNPLGAAIHPTSRQLWIDEMGPKGGDELNRIERGRNYGWPIVSQGDNYDDSPIPRHATHPEFTPPVHSWNPAISPSGLIFYRGEVFPRWRGNAVLGGLSSKALIRVALDGDRVTDEEVIDMGRRIRDVIEAPDGAVLLLSDGNDGELLRLTPADPARR